MRASLPNPPGVGRPPQGGGLSLHHPASQPGGGPPGARAQLRHRGHPRRHRGGRGGRWAGHPVLEAPGTDPSAPAPGGHSATGRVPGPGGSGAQDRVGASGLRWGPGGQGALAGAEQGRPARGRRAPSPPRAGGWGTGLAGPGLCRLGPYRVRDHAHDGGTDAPAGGPQDPGRGARA